MHRAGVLLELHRELESLAALHGVEVGRVAVEHGVEEELENRIVHRRVAPARARHGGLEQPHVLLGVPGGTDVSAVHREAGHDLDQHVVEAVEGEVAPASIALGDPVERVGEQVDLAGESALHHRALALVGDLVEVGRPAGEPGVDAVEGASARRIHEQPVQQIEEFITGGAVQRPLGR